VTLEPLSAERHSAALWEAVRGHDEVWKWLADGPYSSEAELRAAIEQKQAGDSAVFLAIVPTEPRIPEGAGAFMPLKEGENAPAETRIPEGAGAFMPLKDAENARPSGPAISSSAEAAGYASYMRIDPAQGVVEVGNILLSPRLQRTTAATEAMYLMARHVFDDLGLSPLRVEMQCAQRAQPPRRPALTDSPSKASSASTWSSRARTATPPGSPCSTTNGPHAKRSFEAWLDPANFDENGHQRQTLSEFATVQH
jgi:RimJ/RimL family protein N-acetyltransferase